MAEKTTEQERRKARLGQRLRQNLKRRKAQIRSRGKAPAGEEKAR
jgi:hypothetical protein